MKIDGYELPPTSLWRDEMLGSGILEKQRILDRIMLAKDDFLDVIIRQPIIDETYLQDLNLNEDSGQRLLKSGLVKTYQFIEKVETATSSVTQPDLELMFGENPFVDAWSPQEVGHGRFYAAKLALCGAEVITDCSGEPFSNTVRAIGVANKLPFLRDITDYTRAKLGTFNETTNEVAQSQVAARERQAGEQGLASITGAAVRQETMHKRWYDLEALELELRLSPLQQFLGREAALREFSIVGCVDDKSKALCGDMILELSGGTPDKLIDRLQSAKSAMTRDMTGDNSSFQARFIRYMQERRLPVNQKALDRGFDQCIEQVQYA